MAEIYSFSLAWYKMHPKKVAPKVYGRMHCLDCNAKVKMWKPKVVMGRVTFMCSKLCRGTAAAAAAAARVAATSIPAPRASTHVGGDTFDGGGGGGGSSSVNRASLSGGAAAGSAAAPKLKRPPFCREHGPDAARLGRVKKKGDNRWRLFFSCKVRNCKSGFFKFADLP